MDRILPTLASEFPAIKRVSINVRSSTRPATACATGGLPDLAAGAGTDSARGRDITSFAPSLPMGPSRASTSSSKRPALADSCEAEALTGSPLDRRLIFSNFLVGGSNQLAHAEAQRIAGAGPADPLHYNPLYLHASVGLGKTHLLQAVAHAATEARRRVIYLTAERFMYGFVSALKAQTAIAFKERLRAIDVLVIDDIQFLQGKSIQQEFCHTLNALIDSRRQIVIAADRPPGDLESLEERVRSRLSGGLCIEIGALDEALRVKILEARIAAAKLVHQTFEVPAVVVAYVASVVRTNGRDLDGAVNRLLAHASLHDGAELRLETAELAIRDLVRTPDPKKVKIEDIQKLVASHFNVSRADILSARRTASVVRPRQIAMYLVQALDAALASRNWPAVRRPRPHDRPPCRAKDHWSRDRGRNIVGGDRAFEAHAFGVSLLLGLFDRPADAGCLKALWKVPAIPDLTEPLVGMSEAHRNVAFAAHGEPGHGRRAARAGRSPAAARIFCAGASRAASRGLARRPPAALRAPLRDNEGQSPAQLPTF